MPKRSTISTWVRAGLPVATTAIDVRCVGWRPIGASIVAARATSPWASARYSRLTVRAARVLVEAMHDAGSGQSGEARRVMQERVLQRAVAVAAARMHDQTGRLVHNEQDVVLEDDA